MKLYRRESVSPAAYRRAAADLYASLDKFQLGALYDYTEYGYKALNAKLHANSALSAHERLQVHLLDEIITAHATGEQRTLYRGAKRLHSPLRAGDRHSLAAYTSATSDPQQIMGFITPAEPIVFEITTSAGCGISQLREEFEYLLPREQQFTVRSVTSGIEWHAEYGTSGYHRAVPNATVIELVAVKE